MGGKKKKNTKKNKGNNASFPQSSRTKMAERVKEELRILSELRMLARSLLACMQGVAPDGSPFAATNNFDKSEDHKIEGSHPLSSLLESFFDLTERLILVQRTMLSESKKNEKNGHMDHNRDNPEKWQAFSNWLKKCQIHPDQHDFPIEIKKAANSKSGYGIYATRDIRYNEEILKIPLKAMLTPYWDHLLTKDDILPKPPPFDANDAANKQKELQQLSLITFLLNEQWRGKDSPFHEYISVLPDAYSTPLYWSLDGIRELQVTSHFKRAIAQVALTMWDYLRLRDRLEQLHKHESPSNIIPPTPEFSYELFRWATATVHTRQNLIPFVSKKENKAENDVQDALALVPLWDLINHEDSNRACSSEVVFGCNENYEKMSQNEQKNKNSGHLICRTPSSSIMGKNKNDEICFKIGEEIKMYYGERTNAQLLFQSGFLYCEKIINNDDIHAISNQKTKSSFEVDCGKQVEPQKQIINLNKSDDTVIRLALPPAEDDYNLHRVREIIAARFGFKLYVDQNCAHDGLFCAQIASKYVSKESNAICERQALVDEKDKNSVLMAEFYLSPQNPCPLDLERALKLCIADKEELDYLLRNMEKFTNMAKSSENKRRLEINEKHIKFLSDIVNMNLKKNENLKFVELNSTSTNPTKDIWITNEEAMSFSIDLAVCESHTLRDWFNAFQVKYGVEGAEKVAN